ncbi:MAG: hypothetical protein APR63_02585 [Desulfuromonas sp. SDB]|nr:MAG: hypothetical protein APR63_02585 [Desulfuromonas sp. SDB]
MSKKINDQMKIIIMAALSEYFKAERISFKVLDIKPVHTSDVNLWGINGRNRNMGKLNYRSGYKK